MRVSAVIASGGVGKRFPSARGKKQFVSLKGKPLLAWTIHPFQKSDKIHEIIVVVPEDELEYTRDSIVAAYSYSKVTKVVKGGERRQDSVFNGLKAFEKRPDTVIIQDGVRPFVKVSEIEKALTEAASFCGLIFGLPARNTVKTVSGGKIISTVKRETLFEAQTPQIFRYKSILEAYEKALADGYTATDDAELLERLGEEVRIFRGSPENIKITYPVDLEIAEKIMENWRY